MGSTSDAGDELRARIRQQEAVAELGQQALETTDLDTVMGDACVAVAETLDVESAGILELLPDGEGFSLRQGVGSRDDFAGETTLPTDLDSQAGYTLNSETPVIVEDLRTEDRFSAPEWLGNRDVASGISVVIGSVEDPWGVLATHTTTRREFTDHDARFVQSVATVLASAIDRSAKDAQLERYEDYTDEILAGVDDIFYVVDREGEFRRWNDSLNAVTGYSDAEIASMDPLEFVVEEDREVIADGIAEVFETGSARLEATVLTKGGEKIPYEFAASKLEDPEGDTVLAGIGRDVSDRKDRERELAKYETIVETIDDGIYVKDDENRFTMVNDAYAELTGYDREELVGAHASLVVDEDTIAEAKSRREAELDGDETTSTMEATIETADGARIPAEGTFATIRKDDGRMEQIGVVRDITARKRAEEDLRRSEERFRNLMERSPFSIQIFDAEGQTVAANPAWERLWDAPREELADYNILRDEQLKSAGRLAYIRRAFDGEEVTLPITHYDPAEIDKPGRDRWIEGYVYPLLTEDEQSFEVALVHNDITELKEREKELERYEMAVETVWDGITILDSDDRFVLVNDAFTEITGYDHEEAIGEHATLVLDESTYEEAGKLHDRVISGSQDIATLEYDLLTADGETVPVEARFGPAEYADGTVGGAGVIRDITDRRTRERALRENEERFRMLAENLEEMVWISDADTREILYLNSSYEEIFGGDRQSLLDGPRSFLEAVHPNDRERVERAYDAVPDERFDEEFRIVRPDGRLRWIYTRATPIRAEGDSPRRVVGIAEDVTERKERERALAESERRYRTLVENFPNGAVGLFDEDLRYTAIGGELVDASAVDPADRIGSSVYEIYPDEIVDEVEPHFHAALEGEAISAEVEYDERHLFARFLPVKNADDEVYAGMLVVQDVTERREYQQRLEESNERLEQFAYAASHDLQEPLRMVSSYLQLIERRCGDELDDEVREFLDFAVNGADRMRTMIEGLLDYSRIDTQGEPLGPVELDSTLETALENLRVRIEESDAEITAEALPRVRGDERQLQQVFQNLLSNAMEYAGDDPPRIHVSAEERDETHVISVRDEGIGIDSDDQDRIFEVFQRLHRNSANTGSGIGLAICLRIIERHGGEIRVDSSPGEGATFSFTLPKR